MKPIKDRSASQRTSRLWKPLLALALALALLESCGYEGSEPQTTAPSVARHMVPEDAQQAAQPAGEGTGLVLGAWQAYAAPAEDVQWPKTLLDAPRWAQVSAELACAGRSHRGDPDAHGRLVRNIVAHHHTSLDMVSAFSITLNEGPPAEAQRWAAPISEAVKGCR